MCTKFDPLPVYACGPLSLIRDDLSLHVAAFNGYTTNVVCLLSTRIYAFQGPAISTIRTLLDHGSWFLAVTPQVVDEIDPHSFLTFASAAVLPGFGYTLRLLSLPTAVFKSWYFQLFLLPLDLLFLRRRPEYLLSKHWKIRTHFITCHLSLHLGNHEAFIRSRSCGGVLACNGCNCSPRWSLRSMPRRTQQIILALSLFRPLSNRTSY